MDKDSNTVISFFLKENLRGANLLLTGKLNLELVGNIEKSVLNDVGLIK
jgi:hypothetical protein